MTRKINKKFPSNSQNKQYIPSKWISMKSRGYLTYPEASLVKRMKMYDQEFEQFHGPTISSEHDPIEKLIQQILPRKYTRKRKYEIGLYVRIRFFKRIKDLNTKLRKTKEDRKRSRENKQIKQLKK